MSIIERFTPSSNETETVLKVLARDAESGDAHKLPEEIEPSEWEWPEGEAPTAEQFEYEWGRVLDPGVRYICAPVDGPSIDFDAVEWEYETDPEPDAVAALRDEIQALREQREDIDDDERVKRLVLGKVKNGEMDPATAEELAKLNATWDGRDDRGRFEEIDATDPEQVLGAALSEWFGDGDSLDELDD